MSHAIAAPIPMSALTPAQIALVSFLARYQGETHKNYAYHLREWFTWCDAQSVDPLEVTRAHVELYIRHRMVDRGNSASTIGAIMSPIKGYYRYAQIDGLIDRNPAEHARTPKIQYDESRKIGLTRHELTAFLHASQRVSPRHYALGYLLGMMALRVSEACHVRIEDYAETERGYRVLRLVGKGNKPATMPIPMPVLRALDTARGDRSSGFLLTTLDGRQLQRHAARGLVATICRRAGIDKHVHPHVLRAAAITNALDAGVSLRDVQYLARHSDPKTTTGYDRARHNLDRHGVHILSAYLAGGD